MIAPRAARIQPARGQRSAAAGVTARRDGGDALVLWMATLGLGTARADEVDDLLRQARWDDAARAAEAEADARPDDVEQDVIEFGQSVSGVAQEYHCS